MLKPTAQAAGTIPWNCVETMLKDFKSVLDTLSAVAPFEVTDPAAVYVAAHVGSHPEDSIVEVLMTTYSEASLKETKALLRETAEIEMETKNRTGANALKSTATDIVKAIHKLQNSGNMEKYKFVLKAEDLAGAPKFAPEELTNTLDLVRRMRLMETELRSLSTTVAENSGKLKNAPVDGSWAKVAKSKLPPQVQRVKSFHGVKKSLPSSPGTVSPGSPLGVSTPERERSPSAKRSRTTSTDSENDEMDTVVAADGSFTEGGHNKKDRKRARRKTKAIRGNREDVGEAGLIGGSAEVDIVVSGIRKSQNIASLVAYVNDIGKKEDKDIGLQEANCELLVSKDTTFVHRC